MGNGDRFAMGGVVKAYAQLNRTRSPYLGHCSELVDADAAARACAKHIANRVRAEDSPGNTCGTCTHRTRNWCSPPHSEKEVVRIERLDAVACRDWERNENLRRTR